MQTPWGKSDSTIKIETGVSWVGTPSHGGLALTEKAASKYLTPRAIQFAERYGAYLFLEEDCAYSIAFFQNPAWKRFLDQHSLAEWESTDYTNDSYMSKAKSESVPKLQVEISKSDSDIRDDMRVIIESWFPQFFATDKPSLLEAAKTVLARVDHTNIHTTIEDMRDTWDLLRKAIDQTEVRQ